MDNYSSLKTCCTCVAFGKSSCAHPATEIDCFACMKYQEISTPIMKEENKLKHTLISVYEVNDKYIVAKSVEDAIKLYKDAYEWPYNTVKSVKLVSDSAWIEDDENITANMQDCVSSKDYVAQCDYGEQIATALIHATNQGII